MSDWNDWLKRLKEDQHGNMCAEECGIFDLDGNPWATTPDCCVGSSGAAQIKKAIKTGPGGQGKVELGDGKKYMVLLHDPDQKVVVGKSGPAGFTAVEGKQCLVISTYKDGNKVAPGNCRKQVEYIKKELIDGKGF